MILALFAISAGSFAAKVALRDPVPPVACPLDSLWTKSVTNPPRAEYPRMQLRRDEDSTYATLNGAWEWEPSQAGGDANPPIGKNLSSRINVPFPVESCLSGVNATHEYMWYRLLVDRPSGMVPGLVRLHFEAVDWQSKVWVNGEAVGSNTGGYASFSFDLPHFKSEGNEILVWVYDPSDSGSQPMGKQRVSALIAPSGDHYTPSSGIWGPVWIESVPSTYISNLKIDTTLTDVIVNVTTTSGNGTVAEIPFNVTVFAEDSPVAFGASDSGSPLRLAISNPVLWTPENPFLYSMTVQSGADSVDSYFGLRTVSLCKDENDVTRPCLNDEPIFMSGWLDQRWSPDGQYAMATDSMLEFDVTSAKSIGLNTVRVHQKVEVDRFYYFTDMHGLIVWQDAVQHFGANVSIDYFVQDMETMVHQRYNHPSIIQWDIFNEQDCVGSFDVPSVVRRLRELDSSRLVDTNSGGPAEHVDSDVYDQHDYPNPKDNTPGDQAYAADGEYAGIGFYAPLNQQYFPGRCYAYTHADTAQDFADMVVGMVQSAQSFSNVSAIILTQNVDVESECDGIFDYSRAAKFSSSQALQVADANHAFIHR